QALTARAPVRRRPTPARHRLRPPHRRPRGRNPRRPRWRDAVAPAVRGMNSRSSSCAASARGTPSRGAPEKERRVGGSERWTLEREPAPAGVDALEDAAAAEPGEAQLVAEPARDPVADGASLLEERGGGAHAIGDRARPRLGQHRAAEIVLAGAAGRVDVA